ncbi:MAG: STAS/SEC14 domain-containing protein [Alphaproteobacteria bacterium]|nr:STAS/SEC14 domain-containing protein [Alphaproteobacteria bacterium]
MTTTYKEIPEEKTIELIVEGMVTKEDFERISGKIEIFIATHGRIKILEDIRKFTGFDPSILWEGMKFDIKHMKNFSHCAVISDMGWVGPFAKMAGAFISCEVRTFAQDEIEQARQWLKSA